MLTSMTYLFTKIAVMVAQILAIQIPLGNGNYITFTEIYTFLFLLAFVYALFKRVFKKNESRTKD